MKKLCALSRIKFFSQQDGTKNANFAFKMLYFKGSTEIPFADILKYHKIMQGWKVYYHDVYEIL